MKSHLECLKLATCSFWMSFLKIDHCDLWLHLRVKDDLIIFIEFMPFLCHLLTFIVILNHENWSKNWRTKNFQLWIGMKFLKRDPVWHHKVLFVSRIIFRVISWSQLLFCQNSEQILEEFDGHLFFFYSHYWNKMPNKTFNV